MAYYGETPLSVSAGGLGLQSITLNGLIYGNGTSSVGVLPQAASGTVLTGTGAIPSFSSTPSVSSISISDSPVNPTDGVNKSYADSIATGATFKAQVIAASTANLNATYSNGISGVGATLTNAGSLTAFFLDGISPAINSRILVKNQSSDFQNGIYSLTTVGSGAVAWILTRTDDFNMPSEIQAGNVVPVFAGTVNGNTSWIETANVLIVGTDPIQFVQFTYNSATFLQVSNNLSDVQSVTTSRTNLGLGTGNTPSFTGITLTNALSSSSGGTGVINSPSSTITLGGSIVTTGKFDTMGSFDLNFILTGNTSLTLPTSGTVATVGGTVSSITGTANQAFANGTSGVPQTGAVTLTLPQSIATSSSPTFFGMTITNQLVLGGASIAASWTDIDPVSIAVSGLKQTTVLGIQAGANFSPTFRPISGSTISTGFNSSPVIGAPAGQTVAFASAVRANISGDASTGTVTKLAGFHFDGTNSDATQTFVDSYAAYFEEPQKGTSKHGIRSFGDFVSGTTGQYTITRLGEVVSSAAATFLSITTTQNIVVGNGISVLGQLFSNNNSVETSNGTPVSFSGVIPGRTSGSPWAVLTGISSAHNFTVQDNTTLASEIQTGPTFTVPNATSIVTAIGIRLATGSAVLSGTGSITEGVNIDVEEPSFGTTKYAARFKGRVDFGTIGQSSFSRLGVLTLGTALGVASGGTGTITAFTLGSVVFAGTSGVYNQSNASFFWDNSNKRLGIGTASPLSDIHVASASADPVIAVQRGANSLFGIQSDSDAGLKIGVGSGGGVTALLYIAKNANITLGNTSGNQHTLNTLTSSTASSTGGGSSLPALAAGYVTITINGSTQKIPYYAS